MNDEIGESKAVAAQPYVWWKACLWGLLTGWILIFLPYIIVFYIRYKGTIPTFVAANTPEWLYNGSLLMLLPLVQGFVAGLKTGPNRQLIVLGFVIVFVIWFADVLLGAVFLREGVICLVMAAPLHLAIIALGYGVGRGLARWRRSKTVSVSLVPFIVLAVIAETAGPTPNCADAISDSVTVNAPPEYVWKYVVDYPDNPNPPNYWLWQIGLPAPTHSVAPVQAVGARRDCKFTQDHAFEERIAELEPNRKLVFVITKQPQHPEIIGHITVDKGEIVLTPNADGTTTITATSWYRLHVRPAAYFDLWAADVTRHIHFRVLGYMKTLSERDYAAVKRKAA